MTERKDSSGSAFLRVVGRILRFLVRLTFVVLIGVLIGLGLFYGVPWVYQHLVWPVQENSAQIAVLQEQVENNSERIVDNHRALQDRIVALENEVTDLRERTAVQGQDQELLMAEGERLAERITTLEDDIEAQRQDVEQVRSTLEDTTSDVEQEIEGIQEELEEAREELSQQIAASQDDLSGLEGQLDEARARISLLQTAQDLLKVQVLLLEENPGAARDALELAVAHLDQAGAMLPSQAGVLDDLRERMLTLDGLIAERSFRASPTLEALWADVMGLVTPLTAQSTVTETEVISPLPTPTPAPSP